MYVCILNPQVSDVDGAASIQEFSQYPGEKEWLWNVLTYLQYRVGEEELCTTPWGLVRMITVKGVCRGRHVTLFALLRVSVRYDAEGRRGQRCNRLLPLAQLDPSNGRPGHTSDPEKPGLATFPITMTRHDPARRQKSLTRLSPTRWMGMETRHDPL